MLFYPVSFLISTFVSVYVMIIVLEVALGWLIALDIVKEDNDASKRLSALLARFTQPAYIYLRKYIPPVGGIDMSPLVLLIAVQLIGGTLASVIPF